jgi:integrase
MIPALDVHLMPGDIMSANAKKTTRKNKKFKFTDAAIKKLKPPQSGREFYWDTQLGRFGLRVSPRSKTYIVTTRTFGKGRWQPAQRFTIGEHGRLTLAEARDQARTMLATAKARKAPMAPAKIELAADTVRSANTFAAVTQRFITDYLEAKGRRLSTIRAYKYLFNGSDLAAWRDRPVTDITVEDVEGRLAAMMDRGSAIAANRSLAYLRKFFNWCVRRRIITTAPTAAVDAPAGEHQRDRVLSDAELVAIWQALDSESPPVSAVGKLMMLTGQRRNEITGMSWSELHGLQRDGHGRLTVESGKQPALELPGSRSKNHRDHVVPLTAQAVALLASIARDGDLIFSTTGNAPLFLGSKIKKRIDARLGNKVAPWTWHDLRRTFATGLARMKFSRFVISKLLNHADRSVTAIYDRYEAFDEKRLALEAWAGHVEMLTK